MHESEKPNFPPPYDELLDEHNIPRDFASAALIRDEIRLDPELSEEEKDRLSEEFLLRWTRTQA